MNYISSDFSYVFCRTTGYNYGPGHKQLWFYSLFSRQGNNVYLATKRYAFWRVCSFCLLCYCCYTNLFLLIVVLGFTWFYTSAICKLATYCDLFFYITNVILCLIPVLSLHHNIDVEDSNYFGRFTWFLYIYHMQISNLLWFVFTPQCESVLIALPSLHHK